MLKFNGKSVLSGVAIGKIYIFKKQEYTLVRKTVADAEAEVVRFHDACEKAKAQLKKLYEKTKEEVGEDHAVIFEAHQMMLDDLDYVEAIEAMDPDAKAAFWKEQYSKCIRCYACRNICPACNCTNCIFDQSASGWCSKDVNASENQFYGVTRAFHVAGRCIECGQCEAVCPSDIPIMLMNKKFIKDIDTLFGNYEAGLVTEGTTPLNSYQVADPEEFM